MSFVTIIDKLGPDPLRDVPHLDRILDFRGLQIVYRLWGDTSKPVALLQHGGRDHGRSWDYVVSQLLDRYAVAVPDLRGHGDSGWSTGGAYDGVDFVADMVMALDDLASITNERPVDLIGHSFGGSIALHTAAVRPGRVRKVVAAEGLGPSVADVERSLAEPAAGRWAKAVDRRLAAKDRTPRIFKTKEEGIARLRSLHADLPDVLTTHLAEYGLKQVEEGWSWKHDPALAWFVPRVVPWSEYETVYQHVEAPVLLIYGGQSGRTPPSQDGRIMAFQNAREIVYPDARHWVHHDALNAFVADIRDFLAD